MSSVVKNILILSLYVFLIYWFWSNLDFDKDIMLMILVVVFVFSELKNGHEIRKLQKKLTALSSSKEVKK